MNLTPAPICVDCGRDGGRDVAACGRCGGELVDVNLREYFVAMGIAASPMVVRPVAFSVGAYSEQQPTGWEGPVAIIVVGFICIALSAYAAIGAGIGWVLLEKLRNRSLGLGVLYGLGCGAAVGFSLCIVYILRWT